jgi:hypothetical protein
MTNEATATPEDPRSTNPITRMIESTERNNQKRATFHAQRLQLAYRDAARATERPGGHPADA